MPARLWIVTLVLIGLSAAAETAVGQQGQEAGLKQYAEAPARSFDLRCAPELWKLAELSGSAVMQAARRVLDNVWTTQVADPADFDALVGQLSKLGLCITADPQKIEAATSEAAYFMFAARKQHEPRSEPFKSYEAGRWLERKPVFAVEADKAKIFPLFERLVRMMGYDQVRIYAADVYYGVSSYAKFTLYRLGYADANRSGPEVLLGDADYVLKLP